MSAFGGKADIIQGVAKCPLIAKSGPLPDRRSCGVKIILCWQASFPLSFDFLKHWFALVCGRRYFLTLTLEGDNYAVEMVVSRVRRGLYFVDAMVRPGV